MRQRNTRVLVAVKDSGREIALTATMLVSLVLLAATLAG